MQRKPVTEWTQWSDIFKSATPRDLDSSAVRSQLDLDAYRKRTTAHTWSVDDWNAKPGKRARKLPCYLSRFATLKIQTGTEADRSWRTVYLDVEPTDAAIEVIGNNAVLPEYDTLNCEIIGWPDGRSLVVCRNSKIIGGPWVAIIDSATIPSNLITRWTREGRTLRFDGREICHITRDHEACEITPSDCDDLAVEICEMLNASGREVKARRK